MQVFASLIILGIPEYLSLTPRRGVLHVARGLIIAASPYKEFSQRRSRPAKHLSDVAGYNAAIAVATEALKSADKRGTLMH